jgi:Na+/H+-dicarboxylate symporter
MKLFAKIRKSPLYAKILFGMLLGVIVGYIFILLGFGSFISNWIQPWGTIFVKLLKVIAVPLVFVSIIKGVSGIKDIKKLSSMGLKTVLIYTLTTIFAVLLGLGMVNMIQPGKVFSKEKLEFYKEKFNISDTFEQDAVENLQNSSPMDFVLDMVPDNLIAAGSSNSKMLQIIFIALLIGVAVVLMDNKATKPFMSLLDSIDLIILKIVELIMKFAPYGVFALMAGLVTDFSGDKDMFVALGLYALTVVSSLLFLILIFYPTLIKLFSKLDVKHYLKSILPIQLLAFSTSSSSATLPFTIEESQNKLGISEEVASFVLPVGATINMDGTSCYQVIAIYFIAQIFGIELGLAQMLTIILLTVVASIGTPGIPGGSLVMTVMVLTSVGIPVEGLALIVGIDRPLDMLRTVVNVTGDTFVASTINEIHTKKH